MPAARSRFFYGWVIVAISFTTLMMGYGMRYSFPVFFVAMLESFGWSRASTALAFSLHMGVYGLSAPFVGALTDRLGPQRLLPLGGTILALGMAGNSLVNERWHFYLFYGIVAAFGVNSLGSTSHGVVLSHWFVRRRGTVLGIALAGSGAGMFFITPMAEYLIDTLGWRWAYLAIGMAVFLMVVPMNALFQRHRPQDMGLLPDGDSQEEGARSRLAADALVVDRAWASTEWTLWRALKTYRLPLIITSSLFSGIGMNLILSHQLPHYVDVGYDKMWAAAVVGSMGIFMLMGRVLGGIFSDLLGREVAYILGVALHCLGVFMILLTTDASTPWLVYGGVALFGSTYGYLLPVNTAVTADIFQGRHLGVILGSMSLGYGLGGFVGPWLGGYLYDTQGSYTFAFGLALSLVAMTGLFIWLVAPRKVRRVTVRRVQEAHKG